MRSAILFTISLAAMGLAGCQTAADGLKKQVPVPAGVKQQILVGALDRVYDPHSIRDAAISDMIPAMDGGHFVCVKANAKNLMGAYTGRQGTLIGVKNGTVMNAFANHPFCRDPRIKYRPFPELERL